MWYTKYDNCPSFPSWDIVFKRFSNSTLVDPKWPLTSTKNNRLLYSMWYTYIPNMTTVQASLLEILCSKGFTIRSLFWPQMTLDLHQNKALVLIVVHLHTKYEICQIFPSWDIVFTRFTQFDPCWPPNDMWPPPKTIGCLYSMWYTCILHMRSVQYKGFHNLTPVDPKWPLTSTKNNRVLVLNVVHLHTKYEICPSFPSWDIVFTRFFTIWPLLTTNDLWPPPKTIGFLDSMWYTYIPNMRSVQASLLEISCLQGFHNLTPVDPNDHWPPPKTIGFLYSMWYTYIPNIRSVQASLLEISCLRAGVTHTHTHTHTYTHTYTHTASWLHRLRLHRNQKQPLKNGTYKLQIKDLYTDKSVNGFEVLIELYLYSC